VSCLWGRPCCGQGSCLRVAGCGPKAISHSGRPLLLCPYSLLPAAPKVCEACKQPVSWQLQGRAGTESQEDLGQTMGTKHIWFQEGEQCEGGATEPWKAKALPHPQVAGRQVTSPSKDRRSSLRAESSLTQDLASRPSLLARDSIKILRQRARKDRPEQAEPQEMAASASHHQCSLPEESSTWRSGSLPPIRNRPESPKSPPPKTKALRHRQPTPYPR